MVLRSVVRLEVLIRRILVILLYTPSRIKSTSLG